MGGPRNGGARWRCRRTGETLGGEDMVISVENAPDTGESNDRSAMKYVVKPIGAAGRRSWILPLAPTSNTCS